MTPERALSVPNFEGCWTTKLGALAGAGEDAIMVEVRKVVIGLDAEDRAGELPVVAALDAGDEAVTLALASFGRASPEAPKPSRSLGYARRSPSRHCRQHRSRRIARTPEAAAQGPSPEYRPHWQSPLQAHQQRKSQARASS